MLKVWQHGNSTQDAHVVVANLFRFQLGLKRVHTQCSQSSRCLALGSEPQIYKNHLPPVLLAEDGLSAPMCAHCLKWSTPYMTASVNDVTGVIWTYSTLASYYSRPEASLKPDCSISQWKLSGYP